MRKCSKCPAEYIKSEILCPQCKIPNDMVRIVRNSLGLNILCIGIGLLFAILIIMTNLNNLIGGILAAFIIFFCCGGYVGIKGLKGKKEFVYPPDQMAQPS
jgi:hypothetical protein